jgi:hypothetical protein
MFLIVVTVILFLYAAFITFHAFRWAKIILEQEKFYSDVLQVHERTIATFDKLTQMQLFFDSPTVLQVVHEVMSDVKECRKATHGLIHILTQYSKRRYIEDTE